MQIVLLQLESDLNQTVLLCFILYDVYMDSPITTMLYCQHAH